jgi:phosphatidylinositol-3-phosphatase
VIRSSKTAGATIVSLLALCLFAGLELACGGGGTGVFNTPPPIQTPVPAGQPTFSHVVVVVEENHSYEEVIGNSAMPYLNGLAHQYGLATQYYGDAHPSLPNYFMMTVGLPEAVTDTFSGTVTDDNVIRELTKAGKTWKCYAESLPAAGPAAEVYPYVRRHDPFSYLSDAQSTSQAANIVAFPQFATDVANSALPQYSFVSPNLLNDGHDGSLAQADAWLQTNIAPLLASPAFQSSGLLIITFDEAAQSDISHGGGHVATVIISSKAKKNYTSQTFYQHQSLLRLTLAASGVNSFPGAAAIAPDMTEFFQ